MSEIPRRLERLRELRREEQAEHERHESLWREVNSLRERMARVEYANWVQVVLLAGVLLKLLVG